MRAPPCGGGRSRARATRASGHRTAGIVGCQIIEDPFIGPVQPLGRQLVFTAKALRETFERRLAEAGGSLGAWIVLDALSDGGFVSQKALAGRFQVDGATITHHVDRAEARGLVRRQVDPADRRVRRLELTDEGRRLYRRLLRIARELDATIVAGLDEDAQAGLRRALETVRANLDAAGP
ncbi:MAG TPA: MarR family winged helix-turn-helix transcriptional regulator [Gaiellaceae bacterium]